MSLPIIFGLLRGRLPERQLVTESQLRREAESQRLANLYGSQFLTSNESRSHTAHVTVEHWQLRDLIHEWSPGRLLYGSRDSLMSLNTLTSKSETICELDYTPTCLAVGGPGNMENRYAVAGSKNGELTLINLDTRATHTREVGRGVNNGLQLTQTPTHQVIVSSNDHFVKRLSTSSLSTISSTDFPVPINAATVSPDGKKMVACGDSTDLFILNYQNGGFQKTQTYKMPGDNHSFSVSWHRNGIHFGVASQAGICCIWDIRKQTPLARLDSIQSKTHDRGACRTVKFSQDPVSDLIAFSEHANFVTIVDGRDFTRKQVIKVPREHNDVRLSGLLFSRDASKLYIGSDSAIHEYTINTLQRRSFSTSSLV